MSNTVINFVMIAAIVVIILFMLRNTRKRRRDQAELQNKFAPGKEVMTNFGLFGTIVSIDEAENKVVLETGPGQTVTVHRQTLARVVEPSETAGTTDAPSEASSTGAHTSASSSTILNGEPLYGERVEPGNADDKQHHTGS